MKHPRRQRLQCLRGCFWVLIQGSGGFRQELVRFSSIDKIVLFGLGDNILGVEALAQPLFEL